MKPLWQTRGTTLDIFPHPGQWRAWQSERRFTWMLAGTQGGKTSFLPLWLLREIETRGEGDYLAVTATFPLLELKLLPTFLDLFRDTLHKGRYSAAHSVFEFTRSKTRVIFGSAKNPESLESATAKAAVLDECGQDQFSLSAWEAIQRRLSLYQGRALGGTTLYNLGWLRQQVYHPWLNGDPDHLVVQFASTVNPLFPQAEFERARRVLPAWKFKMFYLGQYDTPPGLIYADYQDTYREDGGHLVHPFDLPTHWPRHVGIDPGPVHTATVWLAHDPTANVYYAYHESLEGGKTTPEHAATALAQAAGVNMRTWHLASKSEAQYRLDWGAAGIVALEPPFADVEPGIDRVVELFKTGRLYVFDTLKGLRDELGSYSRETGDDGQVTEKIADKASFHMADALRYVVIGVTDAIQPVTLGRGPWG